MAEARIWLFDVEFGSSVFVKAPNGRSLLIDCGLKSHFSPATYISRFELPGERLDQLLISHGHSEHFLEIDKVIELLQPRTLRRQVYDWDEVENSGTLSSVRMNPPPWREALHAYAEWQQQFPAEPEPVDWGEMSVQVFGLGIEEARSLEGNWINNTSQVVVISIGDFKLLVPADIETAGWARLLERPEVREAVRGTTVYLTASHSHEQGYSPALYEAMGGLPLFNLSVVHRKNALMGREYTQPTRALGVEIDGKQRYGFTNWRDGSLLIHASPEDWRYSFVRLLPTEAWDDNRFWGPIAQPAGS